MPTYEYECSHCKHSFERFQSMTDAPVKRCPKCRHAVKRLLGTGGGIIFKGNGFYETDYRSREYTRKKTEEKGTAPEKKGGEPAAPAAAAATATEGRAGDKKKASS